MSYNTIKNMTDSYNVPNYLLFYGNEDYYIRKSINYIKFKYIDKNFADMNYKEFDKLNSLKNYFEFAGTFPFMSEKKLCILEDSVFLTSAGSMDKKEEDNLLKLFESNGSCITIFTIKEGKPDLRKRIVKKLKEKKAIFEFNRLNEGELTKYITDSIKNKSYNISMSNANYMANNSGYLDYESIIGLYHVNNEINKLISYKNNDKNINIEDIDKLTIKSVESNVFKLIEQIGQNNKKKSFEILDEMLLNNVPEQFLIHMIIRQYRMIYHYIILQNKGFSYYEIMNKMNIKSFVAKKLSLQSKNLSKVNLEYYMKRFLEIDKKIKTGEIDGRIGLELITNGIIK